MKVKVHATYTVKADYEFDGTDWNDNFPKVCMDWVKEDFNRVDTRVANVIPEPYCTNLTFEMEEEK